MEGELKVCKITNPNWLGYLGQQIKAFCDKLDSPTVTYETLYTYFTRTIQLGGTAAEFWVVMQDSDDQAQESVAFAHWFVCDLPHRGLVFCDYVYSWNRMKRPVEMLLDKFIEFGRKKHAPIYKGTAINQTVFRVFRKAAAKRGYRLEVTPLVDFIGRIQK